jgi:hypothetical protein
VMHEGVVVRELRGADITEAEIVRASLAGA